MGINKILKLPNFRRFRKETHTSVRNTNSNNLLDYNVFQEIMARRKTDTLLNVVMTVNIGFSTGAGYFITSESESAKQTIEEWINAVDFEDSIHQLSEDLLSSGNSFVKMGSDKIPIVLPLDSVTVAEYESVGKISKYAVNTNAGYEELSPDDLYHFTWRKSSDGLGVGIASAASMQGSGYFSNSGLRVRKQNYFESREGILDLSLKAFASSLPRYLATTSNANEESVKTLADSLSSLEPLSTLAVSDDISINEMSLDSRSKIDAMIQVLNQEDVTALVSPLHQIWSLQGHSWAAARESVRVMMPFLYSFETAVSKSCNTLFSKVLGTDQNIVEINFGQNERMDLDNIKVLSDILNANPETKALIPPDTILRLIEQAGVNISQ